MEGLLRTIWKEILGKEIPSPIPHMEYDEAMTEYGSDRPDLRFGMKLHDITDLGQQTDFGVFKNAAMVKAIAVPGGGKLSRKETDALAEWAKGFGAKGLAVTKVAAAGLDTGVAKFLAPIAAKLIERTGAKDGDLLCFAADKPKIVHKVLGELRLKMARDLKIDSLAPNSPGSGSSISPLFEFDEEEKRFASTHHPFTAPLDADLPKLDSPRPGRRRIDQEQGLRHRRQRHRNRRRQSSVSIAWTSSKKSSPCSASTTPPRKPKFGFLLDALALRRPAARRHRPGPGPPHHDPPRHLQHPRRDRLPQNPERCRSDVRLTQPN